jgi:hypothetical protein
MKRVILCFISLFTFHFSFSQSWLWGKIGIGDAGGFSAVSDKNGNSYLSGLFFPFDTLQFGSYILIDSGSAIGSGNLNIFIVKYNPSGNVIWAKQTVNINSNLDALTSGPCAISVDGPGNIYLNGNFPDTLLVGSFTLVNTILLSGSNTTFIAKYNSNGNVLWATEATVYNDSSDIGGMAISTDIYGNSYIAGAFLDTIQFGTQTITTPSTSLVYAFLVKYDSNGNVKWARQSTGNTLYGATSYGVASDRFGNSIIGGGFDDSVTFGSFKLGSAIVSETEGDMYIAKYDSNGNVLWAKQGVIPNINSGCEAWALTADKSGNVYVAGDFEGTVSLGTYTIVGTAYNNFFVAKYDTNGNVLWAKHSIGLDNNDYGAETISIDNYNHVYLSVVGGTPGTLSKVAFDGDTLSINDTAEYDGVSLIFKLDSNGNILCHSIIRGGAFNNCIASDTSGNYVYFGGSTTTEMIFGEDTVNPLSYPLNRNLSDEYNLFPFIARWQACDSNIITSVIPRENLAGEVKVYPNPNNGDFILTSSNVNQKCNVEIYNLLGEKIFTETLPQTQVNNINLTGEPDGIYLYRVLRETGELVGEGKIIIEK